MSAVEQEKGGVFNLLRNCLNVHPENKVLVVCENPELGWYDAEAATLLTNAVQEIGATLSTVLVGGPSEEFPPEYHELLDRHDTIIYFARIGDRRRFSENLPGKNVAMLYARDFAALSSAYATTNHHAMKELKAAIDLISNNAELIEISCPLGTDLKCRVEPTPPKGRVEVAIKRFPLCVPQPVLAKEMSGTVALANWLTSTGSHSYFPESCKFDSTVFAQVEQGRIVEFTGHRDCVHAIETHYSLVAEKLGIDKDVVHSWHAGIHPACYYSGKAEDAPDRWSNNIFGNPRFLHFHTCGNYPPGEICWMVLDPTIVIDGVPLWRHGRLMLGEFNETKAVTNKWPELKALATGPAMPIGIDA